VKVSISMDDNPPTAASSSDKVHDYIMYTKDMDILKYLYSIPVTMSSFATVFYVNKFQLIFRKREKFAFSETTSVCFGTV